MRKSILLATSALALLASGAVASAADAIPTPEAAVAAEGGSYVRVCDAFGTGYFYIPGSEACLRVGGQVSFSAGYDSFRDEGYTATEARIDIETAQDSELGAIKTKLRLSSDVNLDGYSIPGLSVAGDRDTQLEIATISVGGFYVGYAETLINTNVLYGDMLDLETFGDLNSTAIGYLSGDLGGGVYAGFAVEDARRGGGADFARFGDNDSPDLVGRIGVKQDWGTFDVSGIYGTENENWFVKATADLDVVENAGFRLTAGYGDAGKVSNDDVWFVAGAGKYNFTQSILGFAGVGYGEASGGFDGVSANAGAVWTPVSGLDVKGEVIYTDLGSGFDTYNTKVSLVRSW
jgi:hypothetical protein